MDSTSTLRARHVLALFVLSFAVGCSRGEACPALEARLCADLGPDCADFRASGAFAQMTPDPAASGVRRWRQWVRDQITPPRDTLCEALGAEPNYHASLVPVARYRARFHRDPATAGRPPTMAYVPPPMGVGDFATYLIPIPFIAGIFGYSAYMRRKLGV